MPDYNRYTDSHFQKLNFFRKFLKTRSRQLLKVTEKIVAGSSDTSLSSFRNLKSTLYRQQYTMMP